MNSKNVFLFLVAASGIIQAAELNQERKPFDPADVVQVEKLIPSTIKITNKAIAAIAFATLEGGNKQEIAPNKTGEFSFDGKVSLLTIPKADGGSSVYCCWTLEQNKRDGSFLRYYFVRAKVGGASQWSSGHYFTYEYREYIAFPDGTLDEDRSGYTLAGPERILISRRPLTSNE